MAHPRELRGAWISTVYNGVWPSKPGLPEVSAKAELVAILDALAGARMNTVFFQVRAESDAVYASTLEPWSRFLTGEQGKDPGWDPLAFVVEEGHRRGVEVHAWLNPYRASVDVKNTVATNHISKTLSSATRKYGTQLWMDPGTPEVRQHILDVVEDILRRYDVDGVHFDDYFYPYPVAGATFDDASSYAAYQSSGGELDKDAWRRSNVDALISAVSARLETQRGDVRFGVSPFGIYRPGTPAGISGLDAYTVLACDPVKWMKEGWVDYVAPQLYWPTTQTAQAFGALVAWWGALSGGSGRSVFVGHDATRVGEAKWGLEEYSEQMRLTLAERERGVRGSIFFSAKPLADDEGGLRTVLASTVWREPAATPPLATATESAPPAPSVTVSGQTLTAEARATTRVVALYRDTGAGTWSLDRLIPTGTAQVAQGRWSVSLIDRRGVESLGRVVEVE